MSTISRFNPHDMSDEDVRFLATGCELLLQDVLRTIDENRMGLSAIQHQVLIGPRGMGKSFFLRLLQVTLADRGQDVPLVLLPEEQPNIHAPADLLSEIQRVLEGGDPSTAIGSWTDEGQRAWDEAADGLDCAIRNATPNAEHPFVVAAVENFDVLLDKVFRDNAEQSRLRKFLNENRHLMFFATTLRADFEQHYDKRLFLAFAHLNLRPWREPEYLAYFRRRLQRGGKRENRPAENKIRALCHFTGGSPRMAVVLADLLEHGDPVSAATTLDRIVDELTPYYQDLTDRMPLRCRLLFDALIRGGEPCSQTELAERVGTQQNRIAQSFAWLQENDYVVGEPVRGRKSHLYRARDRVFVQFFRKRFLLHGMGYTPLATMTDLLETFYSSTEHYQFASRLYQTGDSHNADIFASVALKLEPPERRELLTSEHVAAEIRELANQGQLDEALKLANDSLVIAKRDQDDRRLMLVLFSKGFTSSERGEHQQALDTHRDAYNLAWNLNDLTEQAWNLYRIGQSHEKLGRSAEALEAHRTALALWEQLAGQEGQAWNLEKIGWNLEKLGYHAEALEAYRAALNLQEQLADKEGQAWNLGQLGQNLEKLGYYSEAMEVHHQALALWEQLAHTVGQAWNLGQIGWNLEKLGWYAEALEAHRTALDLREQLADIVGQAWNLGQIGRNLEELGRPAEALEVHRSALDLWKRSTDTMGQAWNLGRIGWLLEKLGRSAEALEMHRSALDLWEQLADTVEQAWNIGHICSCLLRIDPAHCWELLESKQSKLGDGFYDAIHQLGDAVFFAEKADGRAAGFAIGRQILDGLMARQNQWDLRRAIQEILIDMLVMAVSPALFTDLAAESRYEFKGGIGETVRIMELVQGYLVGTILETQLKVEDPDVTMTVKTIAEKIERNPNYRRAQREAATPSALY